jgi:hypothetical protein
MFADVAKKRFRRGIWLLSYEWVVSSATRDVVECSGLDRVIVAGAKRGVSSPS